MVSKHVAVVGAGLAGLAAGLDLKAAGCRVDVYERTRLLGGRATSFEVGGREIDNGQHVFLGCCDAFREFAERVGMGAQLRLQRRFDARIVGRDGTASRLSAAPLPAPFHLLASFARYRHLSLAQRAGVARALLRARGKPDSRDRTFAQWLARHGQGEAEIRAFWDPFVVPAVNAPLERVATDDALFVIRTAFLGDAGAARFGFSRVPLAHIARAAAAKLDRVLVSTAVSGIDVGASSTVGVHLASGERFDYDAVVLALPPPALERVLGDAASFGLPGLERFEAFPIIDVHLWHDAGPLGFDFAALLGSPVQWIFEKAPGYLCASMSAAGAYVEMRTDELAEICWKEARAALAPLAHAQLLERSVTRNLTATYLPPLGEARPDQRTRVPRVSIAGSWTQTQWPDTMEAAVRSGARAASLTLAALAGRAGDAHVA